MVAERGCGIALLAGLLFVHPAMAEGTFRVGLGAQYTSGEYGGDEDIDQLYIPLLLGYDTQRLGVRLTIPYLRVGAPAQASVISRDGSRIVVEPGAGARDTDSGLGDVGASLTLYDVYAAPTRGLFVDLTGRVKLGTADEAKGLGTGETDYALEFSAYKRLGRALGVATLGYELNGDPPGLDLQDVWYGSLGGSVPWTERTRAGVFLDFSQSLLPGRDEPLELSFHLRRELDSKRRLSAFILTGLSDSSPDWGTGLAFISRF